MRARGELRRRRGKVYVSVGDDASSPEGRLTCAPRTVGVRARKGYAFCGVLVRE